MALKPFGRLAKAIRRQDWMALIIELIFLVLGITIAFQLNEWKEARNRAELLTYHQANLRAEVIQNLKEFDTLQTYRIQTVHSLDTLIFLLGKEGSGWEASARKHLRYLIRTSLPDLSTTHLTTYLTEFTGTEQLYINTELLQLKTLLEELKAMNALLWSRKNKYFYDPLHGNRDDNLQVIDIEKAKSTAFRNSLTFLLIDEREVNRLHAEIMNQMKTVRDLLQAGRTSKNTTPKDSLP